VCKEEVTLVKKLLNIRQNFGPCDVGISSDVIEHIREPNALLRYIPTLNKTFLLQNILHVNVVVRRGKCFFFAFVPGAEQHKKLFAVYICTYADIT
jgi:hypothetical protein